MNMFNWHYYIVMLFCWWNQKKGKMTTCLFVDVNAMMMLSTEKTKNYT